MTTPPAMFWPELKGRSVLITGGLGFIGSNLAQACAASRANVTVYDSFTAQGGGNRSNLESIGDRSRLIEKDILDVASLRSAVCETDFVFHCAACTSHPKSMQDPLTTIDVNCKGTIGVLEAVRQCRPQAKFVYVGTSTQIGPMKQDEIDENHPEFPLDIYSATKTAGEKYTLIYGSAHGLRVSVIRLANNYGPRAHIRTPEFGFVNYFIGLGLQNKEITIFGDGRQLRNCSFVEDSVSALIMAALSDRADGETLFAVADRQISVAEIAAAIATHVGGRVSHVAWPAERKAIEVGDARIANGKIKDLLGWQPTWTLQTGLEKTKQYYLACLDAYLYNNHPLTACA